MANSTASSPSAVGSTELGTLQAICWGTRGSVPCPGRDTVRFGGNTACLEVRTHAGTSLIFDAGTGIRQLGRRLRATGEPIRAHLFLTHFHWDHIQGLPFFEPLYDSRTTLTIHAPQQNDINPEQLLAGQMHSAHFPIRLHELPAEIRFSPLQDRWQEDGVEVAAMRTYHPAQTYGYRIRQEGASLAYFPDNELAGPEQDSFGKWYSEFVRFVEGVDCLVHDAMFTADEYATRVGWGHSTFEQAIQLAEKAHVKSLVLFHHAPDRTDAQLDRIFGRVQADLDRRGSPLVVKVATEGEEILVG